MYQFKLIRYRIYVLNEINTIWNPVLNFFFLLKKNYFLIGKKTAVEIKNQLISELLALKVIIKKYPMKINKLNKQQWVKNYNKNNRLELIMFYTNSLQSSRLRKLIFTLKEKYYIDAYYDKTRATFHMISPVKLIMQLQKKLVLLYKEQPISSLFYRYKDTNQLYNTTKSQVKIKERKMIHIKSSKLHERYKKNLINF
uniref:Uncharacterized protein n=2 Tax=Amorphochlora amoebiformis TaxID=1561963 RepID=A0A0H5BIR5_9EUKA|nr:hypothetical protein [Amorphochlora amoebiformis]